MILRKLDETIREESKRYGDDFTNASDSDGVKSARTLPNFATQKKRENCAVFSQKTAFSSGKREGGSYRIITECDVSS